MNLSEVVIRPNDIYEDLARKVRVATIIGTFQSTLTNFKFLRKVWRDNAEEERLLGVSLTGIMDHPIMSGRHFRSSGDSNTFEVFLGNERYVSGLPDVLSRLKEVARETNAEWADRLGINRSKQLTLIIYSHLTW